MVCKKIIIDKEKYNLPESNFIKGVTTKNKIIIGNTFNDGLNHYNGWLLRFGGEYKKTASYTILKSGEIYEHFNPIYKSEYLNDVKLNNESIYILLENKGWLSKCGDEYYNSLGLKHDGDVFIKKWRNEEFWDKYTEKQLVSLSFLINLLCDEFKIDKTIPLNNTLNRKTSNGVFYKSNLIEYVTDVNPSWFFNKLVDDLE